MIKKILIANRGEIAVRIIRACKELGIIAAAVYSEADKKAKHTLLADEAYLIGEAPSSQSYLVKERLIKLAKNINADAIHPGYGFLSENSTFIKMVEEANLIFIGPSSTSVKMMGSKTSARSLMKENDVPVVPGTIKPIQNLEEGIETAVKIGFPVLLKASAGGGGKGMRIVNSEQEFKGAFEAAKREAEKAFGDSSIYLEKLIEDPKHIEVQIIADKHGNYAHLYERECSVQRRHQKIIEESPSPSIDENTRNKITEAAIKAAKACNYQSAGTIEFLMDREKNFYFLEMNTRLQVEHPVTELISGIDLVKEQIQIAAGEKLSFNQNDLKINGHAIECRIYAEDPQNNFLPSTGILQSYSEPAGPGIRVDSGFQQGSEVSVYYDPLVAKIIAWSNNRASAIKRMIRALDEYSITGIKNNVSFLKNVLSHKKFLDSSFNINFIENSIAEILNAEIVVNETISCEDVAAIAALLIKLGSHPTIGSDKITTSFNRWTEQNYE
ncbi:MAG TPA: acetyl-CoA carboxylase biotin carboxylase subunit [Ignavibacteriaceae bacterium]|nr:acetyl-CoA carboxylase biotin carboxylase subunit [Ignavibacteriaceae bacterium]